VSETNFDLLTRGGLDHGDLISNSELSILATVNIYDGSIDLWGNQDGMLGEQIILEHCSDDITSSDGVSDLESSIGDESPKLVLVE